MNQHQPRPLYIGQVFPVYSCQLTGRCYEIDRDRTSYHQLVPGDYEITWIGGTWVRLQRSDRPSLCYYEVGYDQAAHIAAVNVELSLIVTRFVELWPYSMRDVSIDGIYQSAVDLGCKIDHHASDLYLENRPDVSAMVRDSGANWSLFNSQTGDGLWFDIPFAYSPFWNRVHSLSNRVK